MHIACLGTADAKGGGRDDRLGNTAWLLTATALVLFMTLPGLALFYGGLVRAEERALDAHAVLRHRLPRLGAVASRWPTASTFSGAGPWLGDFDKALLLGVTRDAADRDTTIPETVFFMFQLTFAIITPALIIGAFAERMRFGAVLLFTALWLLLVYAPVAHWVWGGGWLAAARRARLRRRHRGAHHRRRLGAGLSRSCSARGAAFPTDADAAARTWLTVVGAGMLWVGWFGFNAGSALRRTATPAWRCS